MLAVGFVGCRLLCVEDGCGCWKGKRKKRSKFKSRVKLSFVSVGGGEVIPYVEGTRYTLRLPGTYRRKERVKVTRLGKEHPASMPHAIEVFSTCLLPANNITCQPHHQSSTQLLRSNANMSASPANPSSSAGGKVTQWQQKPGMFESSITPPICLNSLLR